MRFYPIEGSLMRVLVDTILKKYLANDKEKFEDVCGCEANAYRDGLMVEALKIAQKEQNDFETRCLGRVEAIPPELTECVPPPDKY